jgi:CrcB protein
MKHRNAFSSKRSLYLLIAVMGFGGACARYGLELAFPPSANLPYATLSINVVGCFVMEIVNLYVVRRTGAPKSVGRALGIGFVGAFTTLSAFSTEMLALLQAGDYLFALLYGTLTFFAAVLAALAGRGVVVLADRYRLAHLRDRRRRQRDRGGNT